MEINKKKKASAKGNEKSTKSKGKGNRSFLGKIWRFIKISCIIFFALSILSVILFRWVNPPITPLMVIRSIEYTMDSKDIQREHRWIPFDSISPKMISAIITSEDQNFLKHNGFDFNAIKKASQQNAKGKAKVIKGGSTISQQTAKNVFLWPHRDWVRKGLEAYFTILIEAFWTKDRIMEVYLNIIEFGEDVYGIQAAAQHFYHKDAIDLTSRQAALLAAVVPAPRKWSPIDPNEKVLKHTKWIKKNAAKRGKVNFEQ